MATEAQKQSSLLNSGFLDNHGSIKPPSSPVEFTGLEGVLQKYARLFSEGFAEELDKADANASGAGTSSIRFEVYQEGEGFTVDVYMADYLKYVDQGVQGLNASKSKNNTSPFKFRYPTVGKKFADSLEKWMNEKNVRSIATTPKGLPKKFSPYALGAAIKQRGLRATYFKQKTVDRLKADFEAEVREAAAQDIRLNILL